MKSEGERVRKGLELAILQQLLMMNLTYMYVVHIAKVAYSAINSRRDDGRGMKMQIEKLIK